jgi:hypothetical protein
MMHIILDVPPGGGGQYYPYANPLAYGVLLFVWILIELCVSYLMYIFARELVGKNSWLRANRIEKLMLFLLLFLLVYVVANGMAASIYLYS